MDKTLIFLGFAKQKWDIFKRRGRKRCRKTGEMNT
jgi:hypothetical protein